MLLSGYFIARQVLMRLNQAVAILGLILASCVFLIMHKLGFPDKIQIGAAILCIIFVSIVWSTASLSLGGDDEE